tara:strand:+ start:1478 stop:1807 length:330 start_codon:yes stop_codon:yes gene_type:complete
MSKILSIIAIPLSIAILLNAFSLFDYTSLSNFNLGFIGALYLIGMQLMSYITIHVANKGTTASGKLIKTVLAIPGLIYLINLALPLNLPFNIEIFIGFFLLTEGIYGLH